jgi:hypothetical protein
VTEAEDNPRFHEVFHVLYDSYRRKRGRTLDPEQVQVLVDAFYEISVTMNEAEHTVAMQDEIIEQLQARVETLEKKRGLWTPKK